METPELPAAMGRGKALHERRWSRWLLLAVLAVGAIWGGRRGWEVRCHRRAIAEIKQDIQDGRHGTAARQLSDLLSWEPDSDEVVYLLGVCEKAAPPAPGGLRGLVTGPAELSVRASSDPGPRRPRNRKGVSRRRRAAHHRIAGGPEGRRAGGARTAGARSIASRAASRKSRNLIEAAWDHLSAKGGRGLGGGDHISRNTSASRGARPRSRPLAPSSIVRPGWLPRTIASGSGRPTCAPCRLVRRGGSAARSLPRRHPHDIPAWRARANWAMATGRVAESHALARWPARGVDPRRDPPGGDLADHLPQGCRDETA